MVCDEPRSLRAGAVILGGRGIGGMNVAVAIRKL
jgi:hypothetical protein